VNWLIDALAAVGPAGDNHTDKRQTGRVLRNGRDRGAIADRQASDGASHSMTSSASNRMDWGIVSLGDFAVLRLTTSSYLVGCSTGRSAGLTPLWILSTQLAARHSTIHAWLGIMPASVSTITPWARSRVIAAKAASMSFGSRSSTDWSVSPTLGASPCIAFHDEALLWFAGFLRRGLFEQLQPFPAKLFRDCQRQSGHVSARKGKAGREPRANWIGQPMPTGDPTVFGIPCRAFDLAGRSLIDFIVRS